MFLKFRKYALFFCAFLFVACSEKYTELFNLTPEKWYSQIIQDIKSNELKAADNHYISFASEHIASPLLQEILLILAQAHMDNDEYVLANHYLDEYVKKYGNRDNLEFVGYLKIRANFESFANPNRNQKLLQDSISNIEVFLAMYPNTKFRPLVETMLMKFKLAEYSLNSEIYSLYERTGREESAQVYKEKLEKSPLFNMEIIPPRVPWYRKIFE